MTPRRNPAKASALENASASRGRARIAAIARMPITVKEAARTAADGSVACRTEKTRSRAATATTD